MYRRSAKRWRELKAVGEVLHEHVVKPARSQGTRWIDHRRKALSCLVTNYKSLVMQFEEKSTGLRKDISPIDAATMKGYLRQLKSVKFILFVGYYRDIVEEMAELSLIFQAEGANEVPISQVRNNVDMAQATLMRRLESPGTHAHDILAIIAASSEEESNKINYKDVEITLVQRDVTFCSTVANETINKIITCTNRRFSSLIEDPVVQAMDIFDRTNFPADPEALLRYGFDELHIITEHFRPLLELNGCDISCIEREWIKIKDDIVKHHKHDKMIPLWQKMINDKNDKYPNFLHLAKITLVCPVSTSQVERQFSFIKRFLGDWRTRLNVSTIEDLLRIGTEGPKPECYSAQLAVNRWWGSCIRRPNVKPYGPRKKNTGDDDDDETYDEIEEEEEEGQGDLHLYDVDDNED